jgi:hypothetical protein
MPHDNRGARHTRSHVDTNVDSENGESAMMRHRCRARRSQGRRATGGARPRARLRLEALVTALLIGCLAAPQAWATLGEPAESIAADQGHLRGVLRSVAGDGFRIHEIASADGTTVRQYVSPAGAVFGVSWIGSTVPDLAQLLGSYFDEFRAGVHSPVRRHHPVAVRTQHLVIETGGHMRALRGRVYLPDLVPTFVSPGAIR